MQTFEVPFGDGPARAIVRAAFPGAQSRLTIKVAVTDGAQRVADYWDGGSRDYTAFVELATLHALSSEALPEGARHKAGNPFGLPIADVAMTPGIAIVEHTIRCGKDRGYRITLHPQNAAPLLPAPVPELDARDRRILYAFRSLKSGPYRQEALRGLHADESDLDRLAQAGYLTRARNGATAITMTGRAACAGER